VVPRERLERAPVRRFIELLRDPAVSAELSRAGFEVETK
jgi:molybdate-binding protein